MRILCARVPVRASAHGWINGHPWCAFQDPGDCFSSPALQIKHKTSDTKVLNFSGVNSTTQSYFSFCFFFESTTNLISVKFMNFLIPQILVHYTSSLPNFEMAWNGLVVDRWKTQQRSCVKVRNWGCLGLSFDEERETRTSPAAHCSNGEVGIELSVLGIDLSHSRGHQMFHPVLRENHTWCKFMVIWRDVPKIIVHEVWVGVI